MREVKDKIIESPHQQDVKRLKMPDPRLSIKNDWYKAIIQSAMEGFFLSNLQGKILDVNDAFCHMVGYSKDELLAMKIQDIDIGFIEGSKDFKHEVLEVKKTGGKSGEVHHKCKDGHIIDVLVSVNYLDTDLGLLFCFHRDITERKKAEEELRENRNYLERLTNSMWDAVFSVQLPERVIEWANDSFGLIGYKPEECIGRTTEFLYPDKSAFLDFGNKMKDVIAAGKDILHAEQLLKRKSGEVFPAEITTTIFKEEGEVARATSVVRDITKRKQAEQKHQAIIQTSVDGFWMCNMEGRFLEVNNSFCIMIGYSNKELLEMSISDVEAIESPEDVIWHIQQLKKQGYLRFETRHKRKDGMIIDVEISANYLDIGDGQIFTFARDITERKQAEEALQKSERELAIRNKIADIFLTIPGDEMYGKVLQVVLDAMESKHGVFGYVREDGAVVVPSLTRDIWDKCQIPGKDIVFPRKTWGGIWGRALVEKKTLYSNKHFQVPKGHIPVHRAMATPIIYQSEVIGYFTIGNRTRDYDDKDKEFLETLANNIAPVLNARLESDRQERRRRQAEKKLKESEEKYKDLYDNAPEAYFSIGIDGLIKEANKAAQLWLGYSADELRGMRVFDIYADESRKKAKIIFSKFQKGIATENEEIAYVRKDGEKVYGLLSANPIFNTHSQVILSRSVVRDITKLKQVEAKLQEQMRQRVEFTRALVHELKTPLTPVLGASEALVGQLKDTVYQGLARNIYLGACQLDNRINELLDLARYEINMLKLDYKIVDPARLLKDLGSRVALQASRHNLTLTLDIPSLLPQVLADEERLQQVVLNLLNNAIKFTPDGGTIILRAKEKDKNLIIEVQDSGPGISRELQQRIFRPYYKIEQDRSRLSGLGLGLALCKVMIELHGGQIWCKSKKGKCSIFSFSIPLSSSNAKPKKKKGVK